MYFTSRRVQAVAIAILGGLVLATVAFQPAEASASLTRTPRSKVVLDHIINSFMTATPTTGPVGTVVTLSASATAPRSKWSILWANPTQIAGPAACHNGGSQYQVLKSGVTADASGNFSTTVTIPPSPAGVGALCDYDTFPTENQVGGGYPSFAVTSSAPGSQSPPSGAPITAGESSAGGNPSEPNVCPARSAADPCNTESGALYEAFDDISLPGRGLALDFGRTYNSAFASVPSALGYGWSSSYGMSVAVTGAPPSQTATVTQENGSAVGFSQPVSGSYWTPAAPRIIATLKLASNGSWTFTRQGRQIFTFSPVGQLLSEQDLNGNLTSLSYNANQLSSIVDPSGRHLDVGWTGSQITSVTDANVTPSRTVLFQYNDGQGNLTDAIDVNGGHTQFTYYPDHLLHVRQSAQCYATTGCPGVETHYDTNSPPRVDWQKDELLRGTSFSYTGDPNSANGGATVVTDPVQHQTQDNYQYGLLISETRGYGTSLAATTYTLYDPATLAVTARQDPNGGIVTYAVNANGNPTATTDPMGRKTTAKYNNLNEPLQTTDGNKTTTTYQYDTLGHGNLLSVSTPLLGPSGSTLATRTTTYTYGDLSHPGDVTAMTDPDGNTWNYAYDTYGNRVETKDPLGHVTGSVYNADGWLTASYTAKATCTWGALPPAGCSSAYRTTYGYVVPGMTTVDEFGDVQTRTDPLLNTVTFGYDANRNRTHTVDADGNPTTYVYDSANERVQTSLADGTYTYVSYYDDGTVHTQTDGNSQTTTYAYDALAHVSSVTDALTNATTYTYDALGNELTEQSPGGGDCTPTNGWPATGCTSWFYDADNELIGVQYAHGNTPDVGPITYDKDGQRVGMPDGTGASGWAYDSLGRLTSYQHGNATVVGYDYLTPAGTYDLQSQVGHITYPGGVGTVTQAWDPDGHLVSVQDWSSNTTVFLYDTNGNLHKETTPSSPSLVDTYGFDKANNLTSIVDSDGATLFGATYGRDAAGQLLSDTSIPNSVGSYGYTAVNQLCYAGSASGASCPNPPSGAAVYGYDQGGNLTNAAGTTQQFNVDDQLCWSSSSASANGCMTAPANATTYSYNVRGDLTNITPATGAATVMGFDQGDRMVSWSQGSAMASYAYDGSGLRISKTSGGAATTFAWDDSGALPRLLQEATTSGSSTTTTSYIYGPGGLPVEQVSSAGPLFYHHDQLGSTRMLTDASSVVQATYSFDSYGNTTTATGAVANPLLFAGQYQDQESGFYYLRARYYAPTSGQFLSRDPAVATTQEPYGYVGGNPLNDTDPSGQMGCQPGAPCDPYHGHAPSYSSLPTCQVVGKGQMNASPCRDPSPQLNYVSACESFIIGEICITRTDSGRWYFSAGPGLGTPGPSVSGGSVDCGSADDMISGWSFHGGGQWYLGGGYAHGGGNPFGSGPRGGYASGGTPGGGAFWTYGWSP